MKVKLSLRLKFIILAVFAAVSVGIVVYFFTQEQTKAFFLDSTKTDFVSHVQTYAVENFNLSKPVSLKIGGKYADFAKKLDDTPGTNSVKVLDSNGIIIYSNVLNETGQNFIGKASIQKAINGDTTLEDIDYNGKKAQITSPIKSENGEVRGIIIAEVSLSEALGETDKFTKNLILSLGGILLFFVFILYWIFANTEETMEEQDRFVLDKSKALDEEKQIDEAIMDSVAESLIVINKDGQIMFFNPEAERITGQKAFDIEYRLYKKILNFCDKDGKEYPKNPITEGLQTGNRISMNIKDGLHIKNTKGSFSPISINVAPIFDKNKLVRGVVATLEDITVEKELDRVKDEFVYIVAHELGNPIFALDGYLSILKDKSKKYDKSTKDVIQTALSINQQLSVLVNDLLEVTRNESGQLAFEITAINLSEIVKTVIENAKFKAKAKKIKLSYESPKIPAVLGNEQKIKEVATNLVDNAIKYTPDGGKVEVWHELSEGMAETHVKDNGFGLSKENHEHLFEKFFRVKNDKTKSISGTGLGLFICKQIIEKCSGKIWAESEEGKGSTFSFSLKATKK